MGERRCHEFGQSRQIHRPKILAPLGPSTGERHLAERKRSVEGEPSAELQII